MFRIGDATIPDLAYSSVTDKSKVLLPAANIQSANPGAKGRLGLDDIERSVEHKIITATAHGLTAGSEGKPLSGVVVFNDTDSTHYCTWILDEVIDANTLRVVANGIITFADTLMEGGFDLATDGPYCYFDNSSAKYVATKPIDSSAGAREVIYVIAISGGVVTARVLDWGPPGATDINRQPMAVTTAADGDTTPSVDNISLLKFNNTNPTTVTQFDNGRAGQRLTIWDLAGNTTIDDTTGLVCEGNVDLELSSNDIAEFIFDGGTWIQSGTKVTH